MLYINNADSSYSEQRVTLGTSSYNIVFKYNSRNESWYLNLSTSDGQESILEGIKIMPNQSLTSRYLLPDFEGTLFCIRDKNDPTPLGRNNLGRDKTYRLVWLTEEEAKGFGVNDVVQLFEVL